MDYDKFLHDLASQIIEADRKKEIRQKIDEKVKSCTDENLKKTWESTSEYEKQSVVEELYRYYYKK